MALMPCGTVLVGMTTTFFSVRRSALLGGHLDVLVVREDEHRLRRGAVDLVEDVLGGGVHGLPAGHYAVGAELAEELRHALARADGDGAVGLLGGGELRLGRRLGPGASPPAISLCCSRMFSIFTFRSWP